HREVPAQGARRRPAVERRDQLAVGEVAGGAEHHHRARRRLARRARQRRRRDRLDPGRHYFSLTLWPPNSALSAAITRSRNESAWRERKRENSDSASTGAGTPRSTASSTVQR